MNKHFLLWFLSCVCVANSAHASEFRLEKLWLIDKGLEGPETVTYDPKRKQLYVSNYNWRTPVEQEGTDYLSLISLEGKIVKEKWITGLSSPLGMEIHNDQLYVVERWGVRIIDLESEQTVNKIAIDNTVFLNDLSIDEAGQVFVTDSNTGYVYKITIDTANTNKAANVLLWRTDAELAEANGIHAEKDSILFGVSSDHSLKRLDLASNTFNTLASFDSGIVDGIQNYRDGYLISIYEGQLYYVAPGTKSLVLDTRNTEDEKLQIANFLYVDEFNLLIVPSLRADLITAYRLTH